MDTFVRPPRAARIMTGRELAPHRGALETMIPAIYIRRFPNAADSDGRDTADTTQRAQKPKNARPRKPRAAGHRK